MSLKNRKLNRMKNYNYSSSGYYFVTINVHRKIKHFNVFGEIKESQMILSEYGLIAKKCWAELPMHFKNIQLDNFIIMPDHFHGIVKIPPVGNRHACSFTNKTCSTKIFCSFPNNICSTNNTNFTRQHQKLPVMIGSFKSAVSKLIRRNGFEIFCWHKSYHDHIIRNENELINIKNYIIKNVENWNDDSFFL